MKYIPNSKIPYPTAKIELINAFSHKYSNAANDKPQK